MHVLERVEIIADVSPLSRRLETPVPPDVLRRAAPPPDEIAALACEIESGLARLVPGVLRDHPIANYLTAFDALPARAQYHAVPPEAAAVCEAIARVGGDEAVEAYHRLVLLDLVARGLSEGPPTALRLTSEMGALWDDHLARVVTDVAKGRKGFFRHDHDPFTKDLAVCRGRLLPCGVELLDPFGSVPRSLAWRGGVGQVWSMALTLLRLGGLDDLWALHFDRRLVRQFDADGYARLYLRLADLLVLNPAARGVSSWSWWHDPRLAEISPELSFIGAIPESAGAFLLRVGENDRITADALRFAPARKALYEAGRYRPCSYALVWARDDVLAWAEAYRAGSEQRRVPVA